MASSTPWTTRRLRAPQGHGQVLIDPPVPEIGTMLHANRQSLAGWLLAASGEPLAGEQRLAREALVEQAWRYTSQYRDAGPRPELAPDRPLIVSGHQPQLFHPGVWFKTFLLASLAERYGGLAVNLIIDNDTFRSASIRVPSLSRGGVRVEAIAFDGASEVLPIEEREIRDPALLATFPQRVELALCGLIPRPIVGALWSGWRDGRPQGNLGQALAQARNRLEADWGVANLELPWSEVCRGEAFRRFLLRRLLDADRLRNVYNQCLFEYRQLYRIRSRSHPVPALAADDDWREAPFWVWHTRQPVRRGLFVRGSASGLELTDRQGWRATLPVRSAERLDLALEQLDAWERQGVKVRPRALLTTMFVRLMLSDLFVHGIGGAKYDELTDAIIERYWGATPPGYVVATATIKLPLADGATDVISQLRAARRELRALRFHPETFLDEVPAARPLIDRKRRWLSEVPPRGQRRDWHAGIEQCNARLQPYLEQHRRQCQARGQQLLAALREQRLLGSREFSFCLFPEESLREPLLALSRQES
ncbi:MAG: hypothetical protein J5I93_23365 [Pirellulaceae bacterium]|nr:hypothetical protein [Pirellulaceae bacterium]